MKTRPLSILALLAVLSAASVSPLSAATAANPAEAYPLGAVERHGTTVIRPGDSATKVAACLGFPDQKLSNDTWVYRRFQCQRELENSAECTTLLISFNQGRVSDLMRLNEPAVRVIAAQLASRVAARQIVAGK